MTKRSMSLRVICGESSASPEWTARTAETNSSGATFLSRNPQAPARRARIHVLVEIESRDHRYSAIATRGSDLLGRLDAVGARHPHVDQSDVGAQLPFALHRFRVGAAACLRAMLPARFDTPRDRHLGRGWSLLQALQPAPVIPRPEPVPPVPVAVPTLVAAPRRHSAGCRTRY